MRASKCYECETFERRQSVVRIFKKVLLCDTRGNSLFSYLNMPPFFFTEILKQHITPGCETFQLCTGYMQLPLFATDYGPSTILHPFNMFILLKKIFEADNIAKHVDSKSLDKLSEITLTVRGIGEF